VVAAAAAVLAVRSRLLARLANVLSDGAIPKYAGDPIVSLESSSRAA